MTPVLEQIIDKNRSSVPDSEQMSWGVSTR